MISRMFPSLFCFILMMSVFRVASLGATGGKTWHVTTLDEVDAQFFVHHSYTGIATDTDGWLHLCYRGPNRDLRYASNVEGTWTTEIVFDSSVSVARECSIAVNDAGQPSIAFSYSDGNAEDLYFAKRGGEGEWEISVVFTLNSAGMENDLAFDNAGRPHITHFQWRTGDLLYSTLDQGEWATSTLDDASWDRTGLALDAASRPQIVYRWGSLLLHHDGTADGHTIDTVSGTSGPSIAIDADQHLHVTYTDGRDLKYANNVTSLWQSEIIAASADPDRHHDIAVDAEGVVHIVYYHSIQKGLYYAENSTGAWITNSLDATVESGGGCAISADEMVAISYRHETIPEVVYEAVWANGPEAFAVGHDGIIVRRQDDGSWKSIGSGTGRDLFGIWGSAEDNIYAVGSYGTILHFNGTSWSEISSGTSLSLYDVWGSSSEDIYAVGAGGVVVHWDGESWSFQASGVSTNLLGVWSNTNGEVFAVGQSGTILRSAGDGIWTPMESGSTSTLNAVWGHPSHGVFAVGGSGTILELDEGTWSSVESPVSSSLYDIHGTDTSLVAVGFGRVITSEGDSWVSSSSPTSRSITSVWTDSGSEPLVSGSTRIYISEDDRWNLQNRSFLKVATNDLCRGEDSSGDADGDGICADLDCDDQDAEVQAVDSCGICGGDDSACRIFSDNFESGDFSAWIPPLP